MDLLTMSFSAAVMIAAIVILRALLIDRLPKTTFLILWAVVLLRLLVPVSVPSAWSVYSLLQPRQQAIQTVQEESTVLPQVEPVVSQPSAITTEPVTPAVDSAAGEAEEITATPARQESSSPTVQQSTPTEQPPQAEEKTKPAISLPVEPSALIWGVGAAALGLYFVVGYWRATREFDMSLPVEHPFCGEWLQRQKEKMPLRRQIRIRQFDRIGTPLTYGVRRPTILLPNQTLEEQPKTLTYILTHEYVHIRRFDCVSKLLLSAALCLHWFNPLVWVMYVLANRDLELSCDEMVLRLLGIENRSAYAMALLEMEEKRSGFGALYSAFGKNAIEERIGAIMKMKKRSLLSVVMAVVLVFTLTACLATSPVEEETSAPAAEEKDIIESETVSVTSELTEKEKNQIGWEYNRKWLLWDYTAYGFTYNEETEKWQYQGLDVHAFLDPEKDVHLFNNEPGLSFLATYDENEKLNIQQITKLTADELYSEYFASPVLYDNRIDLYKDNPDTIFVGQWSEFSKRFSADRYLEFGVSLDMESNLVYNGELVRYFVDGVTHDLNDGDFTLDSDLATRQSEECVYLYEYYNPEGTVDLYTVHSREREDSLGGLYSIEEFEPSVLEGKQFQLVDIEEREELNRKVENLSWDDMLEKLSALKAQGITYETIGKGIQMYYNGYPVTQLTYRDNETLGYQTFTSVNPPESTRASVTVRVNVRSDGEVQIEQGKPGGAEMWKVDGRIFYDEEQGVWTYQDQVIRYFVNGVDGQFPTLLQEDGTVSVRVIYDENNYISGLETIPNEQAQALWEQAEAADGQPVQTESTEQPVQTQQLATDTTTAAAPIAPVKETTMVEDVNHYGDTNSRRYWAQEGTPVTCSVAGEVVASGWESGYGNRVQVQDASGIIWTYAHLKEISAQQGDQLQAGEQLGTVGHTGNAGSPTTYCLGLYAEKDGQELNVAQLFARGEEISL